jgi:putative hemolysin
MLSALLAPAADFEILLVLLMLLVCRYSVFECASPFADEVANSIIAAADVASCEEQKGQLEQQQRQQAQQ